MKNKVLTTILVAGMAFGVASCRNTEKMGEVIGKRPEVQQVKDKRPKYNSDWDAADKCDMTDYSCKCGLFPDIYTWAKKRSLDPLLVRAFVETESGFDPHAAAKVCAAGYDSPDCFQPGPSADPGYHLAFDEMYIPEGTAGKPVQLVNDTPSSSQMPRWRWLSFGLMQNLEPPVSFWPASHRPDKKDGKYHDVFRRAGITAPPGFLDLDAAKACNPQFNPFDVDDSLCLGTKKMRYLLAAARFWIMNNKDKLNWDVDKDKKKTDLFAAYVAANKYSGLWDMSGTARVSTPDWPYHPRCDSSLTNGDCWAIGFKESWSVSKGYCGSKQGQGDMRCKDGGPRQDPPGYCYGYTDFMNFVQDCEVPFLPMKADLGAQKIKAYLRLKQNCPR